MLGEFVAFEKDLLKCRKLKSGQEKSELLSQLEEKEKEWLKFFDQEAFESLESLPRLQEAQKKPKVKKQVYFIPNLSLKRKEAKIEDSFDTRRDTSCSTPTKRSSQPSFQKLFALKQEEILP